jgi:hypothetical protein
MAKLRITTKAKTRPIKVTDDMSADEAEKHLAALVPLIGRDGSYRAGNIVINTKEVITVESFTPSRMPRP